MKHAMALVLVGALIVIPNRSSAQTEIKRRILAVYDGSYAHQIYLSELHRAVQTILEFQGLIVDYLDVTQTKDLPDDARMARYRGLVTLIERPDLPRAESYIRWLTRQLETGHKLVILGQLGASIDTETQIAVPDTLLDKFWETFGVKNSNYWVGNPLKLEYVQRDQGLVGFERNYPPYPPEYKKFGFLTPDNRPVLTIGLKGVPDSASPVVFLNDQGGLALSPYFLFEQTDADFLQWYLDPFAFFEAAFGTKGYPRPDVSTINGRRVYYSHVDADGMTGFTEVNKHLMPGDIIRDQVFKKYNLPVTASVIVGEIAPDALGSAKTVALARSIYDLPNVEAGCHSYSHPFYWTSLMDLDSGSIVNEESPYGDNLTIPGYTFSLQKETQGAMEYINAELVPKNKKCQVFQWTGNCRPPAEAIALVDQMGVENINGADSVFDSIRPSVTGIAPLVCPVGDRIQIYNSMANDNIFTNLWVKPYWGFRRVILTFEKTEHPRRLRPINVYYHFFSGSLLASLNGLRYVMDYVMKQDLAPVHTSHYCRMVRGFLSARMVRLADGGFEISDYGEARTVRYDRTTSHVNLTRSENVLGYRHYQGSLYVHFGPGRATVYLTDTPSSQDYLYEASGVVGNWTTGSDGIRFEYRGWTPGIVIVQTAVPGQTYVVEQLSGPEPSPLTRNLTTDQDGRLMIKDLFQGPVHLQRVGP